VKTFGLTPDVVQSLEKVTNYDTVMDFFANLGARMGEAPFVNGNNRDPMQGMSYEAAMEMRAGLLKDGDFIKRYQDGESAAVKQMQALSMIIANGGGLPDYHTHAMNQNNYRAPVRRLA
jgi:hypothetical protein